MTTDQTPEQPRVAAHVSIDGVPDGHYVCSQATYTTPEVHVSVGFDLHDHQSALAVLESAVANVRAQIEETK